MKTVIFDIDGVLLDTERYYYEFGMRVLEQMGFEPKAEMILNMRSLARPLAEKYVREVYGNTFDLDTFREYRRVHLEEMYARTGVPVKPGAREVLTILKEQGVAVAVATANPLERAQALLDAAGLSCFFTEIHSAHDVPHGKPAPDVYLDVCYHLGKSPEDCYAVEDSPNGVRSASSAGCKTIMIVDLSEPDEDLKKQIVGKINSLSEIPSLILKDDKAADS